jgi:hypothetical protein
METGICYKYFATFSIISYDTLNQALAIVCQNMNMTKKGTGITFS